ncbi:MAG: diaminopimelate epimerase [Chitinophagales bacterium]
MEIPFSKYQGTGNDFIIIDNRQLKKIFPSDVIARWCHRRFGIGADGLMLLEEADGYDFSMVYFNSDGKQSTMCGNGGRCLAQFAKQLGIVSNTAKFVAIDGPHDATFLQNEVQLQMIDVTTITSFGEDAVLNTGSPHYVTFREQVKDIDVFAEGRSIRQLSAFREEGINVNFVETLDDNLLYVRTYERGVEAETMSCGTGVVASALAHAKRYHAASPIHIETPGGHLHVAFTVKEDGFSDIWLGGPATLSFEGKIADTTG